MPYEQQSLSNEYDIYKGIRQELATKKLLSFEDVYINKEKIGEIEKRLRSQKDFAKLITHLFEQAAFAKVDITNVNYNFEEKKEMAITKLALILNVEGRYEGLRRFLYNMERGSHLFEVSSLKIARAGEVVSATVILTSYLKAGN